MSQAAEVERIVRSAPWLMDALEAAREVDPPDWVIGAGAVRGAVWDGRSASSGSTADGVRLERDGGITVVAPHGLDDLLELVLRRNPARVSVEEYERRLRTKRVTERWPRVRVLRT